MRSMLLLITLSLLRSSWKLDRIPHLLELFGRLYSRGQKMLTTCPRLSVMRTRSKAYLRRRVSYGFAMLPLTSRRSIPPDTYSLTCRLIHGIAKVSTAMRVDSQNNRDRESLPTMISLGHGLLRALILILSGGICYVGTKCLGSKITK